VYNRKVLVELDEEKRLENMFDDDHYSVPVLFIKRLLLKFIIGLLKDAFVDLKVIFTYYKYSFYYISPPNATFYSCSVYFIPSSSFVDFPTFPSALERPTPCCTPNHRAWTHPNPTVLLPETFSTCSFSSTPRRRDRANRRPRGKCR
jgi:hypothetical protein